MKPHPVPKVGDTVVLNDYGIDMVGCNFSHMKTLRMKITWVDSVSATAAPYLTYPVEVDNEEVTMYLIDHRCFDIVDDGCRVANGKPCDCQLGSICKHLRSKSPTRIPGI